MGANTAFTGCEDPGSSHKRAKGFSNITTRIRKKPSVNMVKVNTQGIRRRSERQLSTIAAPVKVLITHAQNISEPGCPPHRAVILKNTSSEPSIVNRTHPKL